MGIEGEPLSLEDMAQKEENEATSPAESEVAQGQDVEVEVKAEVKTNCNKCKGEDFNVILIETKDHGIIANLVCANKECNQDCGVIPTAMRALPISTE